MATQSGIGYSPLTEKVYIGKQNPDKNMWVGKKKDITHQFIDVAFSYFEVGMVRTITTEKEKHLFFHITEDKESLEKAIKHLQNRLKKKSK